MKKLLVIDDDLIDAGFVLRAFSDVARDFEVVHVVDADVASTALWLEAFDYILMDINMPGTDGIDLLRRIRTDKRTADVPVIMLTSSTNPKDVQRSYSSGANAYTVKPSSLRGYRDFAEDFARFWVDHVIVTQRPSGL